MKMLVVTCNSEHGNYNNNIIPFGRLLSKINLNPFGYALKEKVKPLKNVGCGCVLTFDADIIIIYILLSRTNLSIIGQSYPI